MKINRRLNLVLEIERADKTLVHVHHIPISEETYEAHWEVITKTVNECYMQRFLPTMAVRVGRKMLLKSADTLGVKEMVEKDLLPNMWRTTTILVGSQQIPFDVAINQGDVLDEGDIKEVKDYITFFTCASWVHPAKELEPLLYAMIRDSGAQITSLNAMEFATSLQTSKPAANTGASPPANPLLPPH